MADAGPDGVTSRAVRISAFVGMLQQPFIADPNPVSLSDRLHRHPVAEIWDDPLHELIGLMQELEVARKRWAFVWFDEEHSETERAELAAADIREDTKLLPLHTVFEVLPRAIQRQCGQADLDPRYVDEIVRTARSVIVTLMDSGRLLARLAAIRQSFTAEYLQGLDPEARVRWLPTMAFGAFLERDYEPAFHALLALWDNVRGRSDTPTKLPEPSSPVSPAEVVCATPEPTVETQESPVGAVVHPPRGETLSHAEHGITDQVRVRFADAHARFASANLFLTVLPMDGVPPSAGHIRLRNVVLPHEYVQGARGENELTPLGPISDADCMAYLVAVHLGTQGRAAFDEFVNCATLASQWLHRLPPHFYPPTAASSPWIEWCHGLWAYLRNTPPFIIDGDGHSRITCMFSASMYLIRLMYHGNAEGHAPVWPGICRPGRPGSSTGFTFEWENVGHTPADEEVCEPEQPEQRPLNPMQNHPEGHDERAGIGQVEIDDAETQTEPTKVKGKMVEAQMRQLCAQDPERRFWTAARFAEQIDCSDSCVVDNDFWRIELAGVKAQEAAARARRGQKLDGRRTPRKRR